MQYGLKATAIEQIKSVFSRHSQVECVILYGSRAMGNFKKGSDIDFTLKGEDLSLSLVHKIEIELDDLLLPYTFDISIFGQISNMDLVEHINRAGVVFYKNPESGCSGS